METSLSYAEVARLRGLSRVAGTAASLRQGCRITLMLHIVRLFCTIPLYPRPKEHLMPDKLPGGKSSPPRKRILFVDLDDTRRETRVRMLTGAGHEVEVRADHEVAETLDHEGTFDLLLLALHKKDLEEAAAYSETIRKKYPTLPILLLLDVGVFVPRGTLSESIETGFPFAMLRQIGEMLAGSSHVREIPG